MINPVDMSSIANVRERISAIQERLGLGSNVPGMEFEKTLQKEMSKLQRPAEVSSPVNVQDTSALNDGEAESATNALDVANTGAYSDASNADVQSLLNEAAAKYNVDQKLLSAVAQAESGMNQNAVSYAGAIGVMQLMPSTAAGLGINPYDVRQNIDGGAKVLKQHLDTFGGDIRKALAAYNAGPNAVKSYGGVPPYPETQSYVAKVLDIYR